MKKLVIDKIASVLKNVKLPSEVFIGKEIDCSEGAIIAARVLEDKKIYNSLELTSGRLSTLHKGDVIAVALGNRRALRGFVGEVPKSLEVGEVINLLNLGGVAGICTSANEQEVGNPLPIKVLGAIVDEKGPLNIKQFTLYEPVSSIKKMKISPLVVVSGTCMHVGKTTVACELIKHSRRKHLKVVGAKLAGIAALRDTENMKDYGARKAVNFIDAGFTSTVNCEKSVEITKGAIAFLSRLNPDFIVIEFGDGIYGEYGVKAILEDREIQKNIKVHIGCAYDQPGVVNLVQECKRIKAPIDIVSGPITDNSVGMDFVAKNLKLPAFNAISRSKGLFDEMMKGL